MLVAGKGQHSVPKFSMSNGIRVEAMNGSNKVIRNYGITDLEESQKKCLWCGRK